MTFVCRLPGTAQVDKTRKCRLATELVAVNSQQDVQISEGEQEVRARAEVDGSASSGSKCVTGVENNGASCVNATSIAKATNSVLV